MPKELKFEADWLAKDARKAAEKLGEWAASDVSRVQETTSRKGISGSAMTKSARMSESR